MRTSSTDGDWNFDTTLDTSVFASDDGKAKNKNVTHSLQNELMALVKLRNPNIVETLGATFIDKKMIIVLQYMKLNTVRSILKDGHGVAGTAIFSLETQWVSSNTYLKYQTVIISPSNYRLYKWQVVLHSFMLNLHQKVLCFTMTLKVLMYL